MEKIPLFRHTFFLSLEIEMFYNRHFINNTQAHTRVLSFVITNNDIEQKIELKRAYGRYVNVVDSFNKNIWKIQTKMVKKCTM